jgi:tetratricopeptide (TPR) repeat protein
MLGAGNGQRALEEDLLNELRLIFSRDGEAITYRLTTSWGDELGEAQPFVPFLSRDDDEDLRWYLEEYMELPIGGALVRARRIEQSLAEWGRRLFGAVFDEGERRELFDALVNGNGPRLLLTVATKDLDVLRLPWELMASDRGPLTTQGVTIRRQLETARRPEVYETGKLPLRILLAVSRPDDSGFIDPRHTTRAMLEALGPLGDGVVVDFCRPASLEEMERMLGEADRAERPYQIVHFDGHGSFDPVRQTSVLYFERDSLGSKLTLGGEVPADDFGALMAQRRIPLVILEACRSGQVGTDAAFRGVAPALIEAGVGSVLAMSHAVHVEAAKVLLARIYAELAEGATIGEALEHGRAALVDQPERWLRRGPGEPTVALSDWFLPQLYQLGDDRVLVPGGAEKAPRTARMAEVRRAPAQGTEVGAFPGEPMYGFFGRAHELHRLERRFLKNRAVVLHAMGGMGKTSLAREAAFWWTKPTGLFPDGACFVSFEQAGGARRAVQVIGAYFEGAEFEKRSEEEQGKRAKELFQTKRVLVVWDNFESVLPAFQEGEALAPYPEEERAEIYRLFKEWTEDGKGPGRLLVTCRPGETGLLGACKVALEGLARADALSLLYGVMAKAGVKAAHERDGLLALLNALDRQPLSIELVGPHLKGMGPEQIMADFQVLLDKFEGEAAEGRNRSLKASIGFSLMRLSKGAREAVRWLGLFRGGVFEVVLIAVSSLDPASWRTTRKELVATALVRVDEELRLEDLPYLRFHPTLAVAAGNEAVEAGARETYFEVYRSLAWRVHKARGAAREANLHWGMKVMVREEANFRRTIIWALEQGDHDLASLIGEALANYLQLAGRLREQNRWTAWLVGELRKGEFSEATADWEIAEALALLSQGEPRKGIGKLEALVARLKTTTEFDAAFVLANCCRQLGRAYTAVGLAQKAVPVLKDAVAQWEALLDKAQAVGLSTYSTRGNLGVTLGTLANALLASGVVDEALTAGDRAIAVSRECEDRRSIATGLVQTAQILTQQGRHAEANARYDEAIQAGQGAGDLELGGQMLYAQADLARKMGKNDRATKLLQRALQLFQDTNNEHGVMLACNALGAVEEEAGRLAEARAWYERSREIAKRRDDQKNLGGVAQNLGRLCREEARAARKQGDEAKARERFTEAARFFSENLEIEVGRQNEPSMADCHRQVARIHLFLGDLDKAETHAHHGREIDERLGLEEAWKDYFTLAEIADARNQPTEAAAWNQKCDTLVAEINRRAGAPVVSQQLLQDITRLALACAQTGIERASLSADAENALDAFSNPSLWAAPFDTLAPFFRTLAAGTLPAVPPSLPAELISALTQVLDTIGAEPHHPISAPAPPPLPSNAPCPCGSGKPFLDCHAADADQSS